MYSIIFIVFHVVFVGFATLMRGSLYDVVYFLIVTAATAAALRGRFRFSNQLNSATRDDVSVFVGLSALVIVMFVLNYAQNGLPMLSQNMERARVFVSQSLGRFPVVALFVLSAYGVLIAMTTRALTVKIMVAFITCVFLILLFLTGYRSRIADALLVMTFAAAIADAANSQRQFNFLKNFLTMKRMILAGVPIIGSLLIVTAMRFGGSPQGVLLEVFDRLVLLNYEINFVRVLTYTDLNGFQYGGSFIRDVLSIVTDTRSTQEYLTNVFNPETSSIFVMTLPAFTEARLNFPIFLAPLYAFVVYIMAMSIDIFFKTTGRVRFSLPIFNLSCLLTAGYFFARVMASGGIANSLVSRVIPVMIVCAVVTGLVAVIRGGATR